MTSPSIKSGDKKSPEKRSGAGNAEEETQQPPLPEESAIRSFYNKNFFGWCRVFRLSSMMVKQGV
jgi:hypothetical protein